MTALRMPEVRRLPVPNGLTGMRVDAGLAKLLGMSRTTVATMIDAGDVLVDGTAVLRSAKLIEDSWLEITLPEPDRPPVVVAQTVEGLTILYRDADIAVVDKPVGVAAHPSPGWTGPTVLGALAGLGIRTSTSGAEERRGIVHRLDVGTTGVMVVALSERAYTVLKDAFRDRTVEKIYHAVVQGHVVDFVSVFGPNAEYFPVFNVADSAITIGGVSLVITALLGIDFDGSSTRKPKPANPSGGSANA